MQEFSPADTKPLLIFGGPYSNLAATKAIKEISEVLDIPAGNILCTGDIVAYCASPQETTDLIREWGITVVQGNCEESLGNDASDCGCGFDEGSACDLLSASWFSFAKPRVSADAKTWMATLPTQISFTWAGLKMHAIHGGLNSINQFIFASDITEQAQQQTDSEADVIISGHCGIPFGQQLTKGTWLNAGVIGMPANDGQTNTWYMLITQESDRQITASWHGLEYDVEDSINKMCQAGLNTPYAEALNTGYWPSTDILPPEEQVATGKPLNLSPLTISAGIL